MCARYAIAYWTDQVEGTNHIIYAERSTQNGWWFRVKHNGWMSEHSGYIVIQLLVLCLSSSLPCWNALDFSNWMLFSFARIDVSSKIISFICAPERKTKKNKINKKNAIKRVGARAHSRRKWHYNFRIKLIIGNSACFVVIYYMNADSLQWPIKLCIVYTYVANAIRTSYTLHKSIVFACSYLRVYFVYFYRLSKIKTIPTYDIKFKRFLSHINNNKIKIRNPFNSVSTLSAQI